MYSSILMFSAAGLVALGLYVIGSFFPRVLEWTRGDKVSKHLTEYQRLRSQAQSEKRPGSDSKNVEVDPFKITPLPDFNWRTTPPLKFRAFKPKYHLTMAVNSSNLSELIEMDRNYLTRINLRKQIMKEHHDIVIQARPTVKPAIDELYIWLVNTYLPTRYPTMFSITPLGLLNHTTSEYLPLQPFLAPVQTFETLGQHLDEDILILLPSEDGDGYSLMGYVTCFPAGFNTKEKLGMKLRDIHTPVPGYKQKLELSMDRFFDRLEVGKVVKRSNWSVNTEERLFAASGLHYYEGEETTDEEVDINTTFLRCERQLLHRLPKTRALVFNFKTYLYPLSEIKEEGLGEDLAQAIDGLKEGSTPAMHFYKRGVVWGDAVKAYLRS